MICLVAEWHVADIAVLACRYVKNFTAEIDDKKLHSMFEVRIDIIGSPEASNVCSSIEYLAANWIDGTGLSEAVSLEQTHTLFI